MASFPPEMEHILRGALTRRYGEDYSSPDAQEVLAAIMAGDNEVIQTLMSEGEAGSPQTGTAGLVQLGLAGGSVSPMLLGLAKKAIPALAKIHPLGRLASGAATIGNLGLTGYGGYNIYDALKREQLGLPGTGMQAALGGVDIAFPALGKASKIARRAGSRAASKFPGLRRKVMGKDTSLDDPTGGIWRWATGGKFKPKEDFATAGKGFQGAGDAKTAAARERIQREKAEKLAEESGKRFEKQPMRDPDIEYEVSRRGDKQPVFRNIEEARAYDRTSREVRDPRSREIIEEGRQPQRGPRGEIYDDPRAGGTPHFSGVQAGKLGGNVDAGGLKTGPGSRTGKPIAGSLADAQAGRFNRPLRDVPADIRQPGGGRGVSDKEFRNVKTDTGTLEPRPSPEETVLSSTQTDVELVEEIYKQGVEDLAPANVLDNFEDVVKALDDPTIANRLPLEQGTRQQLANIWDASGDKAKEIATQIVANGNEYQQLERSINVSLKTEATNAKLIQMGKLHKKGIKLEQELLGVQEKLVSDLKGVTRNLRNKINPTPGGTADQLEAQRAFENLFAGPGSTGAAAVPPQAPTIITPPVVPPPGVSPVVPPTTPRVAGVGRRRKPSNQMNLFGPDVPPQGQDFMGDYVRRRT